MRRDRVLNIDCFFSLSAMNKAGARSGGRMIGRVTSSGDTTDPQSSALSLSMASCIRIYRSLMQGPVVISAPSSENPMRLTGPQM